MQWKAHVLATLFFGIVILFLFNSQASKYNLNPIPLLDSLAWLALAAIASLVPDLDLQNGKLNEFVIPAVVIAVSFSSAYLFGPTALAIVIAVVALLVLHWVFRKLAGGHRGNMHKFGFGIVLAIPVGLWFGMIPASAVVYGVFAHIFEDKLCDKTGLGG